MILIGNWKMNTLRKDIDSFIGALKPAPQKVQLGLSLPFPYLEKTRLPKGYLLGGQECSSHEKGPFTGQVSAAMLKDVGCGFVLLGHPEVGDEDDVVKAKANQAHAQGLIPVICVAGPPDSVKGRLPSFQGYSVAYEPAIGAEIPPDTLSQDVDILRQYIGDIPLLYGGGVNPETVKDLLDLFDGFLVGRASLDSQKWHSLVAQVALAAGKKEVPILWRDH
jgi:triosephosphate isomerase